MPSASTILVIDDEPNLRCTLSLIFKRAGHSVTVAANTNEARKYLTAGAFDLVFLDLKMPEGDGLSLLPFMRRRYPNMPVLILTAHASLESAIQAVQQGARDYLLKPVDPALILDRVDGILAESQRPKRRREILGELRDLVAQLGPEEPDQGDCQPTIADEPFETGFPTAAIPLSPIDPARYLQCGPLLLDLHARHATLASHFIPLSPTAFDYLVTLARHSPNPVSTETLVLESQGYAAGRAEAHELARWRIHELRKALEPDPRQPRYIITVRGAGYRLIT